MSGLNEKLNVAVVGLGARGKGLLPLLLEMDDVNVMGVCDLYEDRMKDAEEATIKAYDGKRKPVATREYRELLDLADLDAVITPSSWTSHAKVCLDTMKAGKYAATEVGGATSIQQCWDLVHTSEETGMPCMMLENCCYGQKELTVLNMVKKGMFGELVHAEGGYRHDLREEIDMGVEKRHYRLNNYKNRNGEVYSTHALGPIAKFLNINRGNRMLYLTSTASKAAGLNEWARKHRDAGDPLASYPFAMGDVITTVIKCAHGETITLNHDTSLPRPYSRGHMLQGTKGLTVEDHKEKYLMYLDHDGSLDQPHNWENLEDHYDTLEHPLWKEFRKEGVKGGHGGMDWLVLRAFVEAVMNRTQTPIDVYDTASWMAVTCLSEDSAAMGSAQVAIPDFTDGAWINREPWIRSKYCLEEVCEDLF